MKTVNRTRPDYDDTIRMDASHIVQRLYFDKPEDVYFFLYRVAGGHRRYKIKPLTQINFMEFMEAYIDLISGYMYEERFLQEAHSIINNGYNKKWMDKVVLDIQTVTSARVSVSNKTGKTHMYIPFQAFHIVKGDGI